MSGKGKFSAGFLLVPVICLSIASYFGFHAARSMEHLEGLQKDIVITKSSLAVVKARRKAFEHRVKLLRPGSLDPDMLDERARAAINAARAGEIIVFRK